MGSKAEKDRGRNRISRDLGASRLKSERVRDKSRMELGMEKGAKRVGRVERQRNTQQERNARQPVERLAQS